MNERITTFAESLFIFWQYPFLLYIMGMSGHKNLILFLNTTHTKQPDQKQQITQFNRKNLFSLLEAIGISQKNELWWLRSLFLQTLLLSAIPLDTTHCAMCTKLCLCGGGYGCTNSIWSEKKEDSAYLALGSSSFQIWKDLLIYSDILQKDWARLVCR